MKPFARVPQRARSGSLRLTVLIVVCLVLALAEEALAASLRIRLGTVAPKGSVWTDSLEEVRQEWLRISEGTVDLRVYPGGVLGDESEMLRKVRSGTLQGVALSSVGLSRVEPATGALAVPLMYASYEELDYVRERLAPELESRIEQRGFVVVNWSEAGWVRFFTKRQLTVPDELRRMRLFTSAGDPDSELLWKEFGFNVVPMALTDMLTALQTGMLDAFDVPPLFALLDRSYTQAEYMLDLPVAPIVGGTLISEATWRKVPERFREPMLAAARKIGERLSEQVRRLGEDSIHEMESRGLVVTRPSPEQAGAWQREAESKYPQLRGRYAPAEVWDRAMRLRDEFRSATP